MDGADPRVRVECTEADALDLGIVLALTPQGAAALAAEDFREAVVGRIQDRISSSPETIASEPGAIRPEADAAVPVRRWQRVQWQ